MAALVDTVEQNGVKTRVMVTDVNMNGMENRAAIEVMQAELTRRGVSDLVEFRYLDGRMHTKSLLVDGQLLIVGSQNFHYSAYGDSGLAEYNLATNDSGAIQEYQQTFDYYWEQAKPIERSGRGGGDLKTFHGLDQHPGTGLEGGAHVQADGGLEQGKVVAL
jgi:phosphatidylserine/phosphatidylglycerophosphate/cardiolipin synthase-like enzyme